MAKTAAGLAVLISIRLASGAWAQEPKTLAPMFPPVAQLLGPEPPAARADADALIKRLGSPDPAERKAALVGLGRPDNMKAVPYLGGALLNLDEPVDVRVAAAVALGRVRNWRAVSFLKLAVRDAAKEVRFAVALALGKTKSREALPLLIRMLGEDQEWWVRFAAAVALGDSRDPLAVAALGRAAAHESEWQVRMQAVRSLGHMGSRDAARALEAPLRDPDASVRAVTAMALSDIGGLDALSLLARALHDESDEFPRQVMSDSIKKLLSRP